MSYDDYRTRDWIVTQFGAEAKCQEKDIVTFEGESGMVTVVCMSEDGTRKRPYAIGEYVSTSNTIKRTAEYEISMMKEPPRTITFTPEGGSFTGSWTAEENGPWPRGG